MGVNGWLLTGVTIVVLLAALVWRIGASSQKPRKLPNGEAPGVDTDWHPLSFSSDGSKLEGWLLQPAPDMSAAYSPGLLPLVVVAHGWGSNRTRVLRYARPLNEAGFAVFMYDARSHGDSESIKAPSAFMFRDDVIAAVDTARRLPGIDPDKIAVLGHSLGGFGALLALDKGMEVNAVITDSMPVRFETMMRAELNRKKIPAFPLAYLIPPIWLFRARISQAQFRAANIPEILSKRSGSVEADRVPVLMIHSNGDDFISAEDLRQLKGQLPEGTIDTLFVSTKGHSASEQEPGVLGEGHPFFAGGLKSRDKKGACGTKPQAIRENI